MESKEVREEFAKAIKHNEALDKKRAAAKRGKSSKGNDAAQAELDLLLIAERQRAEADQKRFEAAVEKLPASASHAVVMNWIRQHPAMSRLDRLPNRTKESRIILTASDITKPPKAPSATAVYQLQHWCNRPEEFNKMLLQSGDKFGFEDESNEDVVTPQMKDLNAILRVIVKETKPRYRRKKK